MAGSTRTHYEILGVSPDATAKDIKKAYHGLARNLHPDVSPGTDALFGVITEAFEVLSNETRRAEYDRQLRGGTGSTSSGTSGAAGYNPFEEANRARQESFRRMQEQFAQERRARAEEAHRRAEEARLAAEEARRLAELRYDPRYWVKVVLDGVKGGFSRKGRATDKGAASSKGGNPRQPAWWTLPLIVVVAGGLALARFTGFTADLFGIAPGSPIAFGGVWYETPSLDVPDKSRPFTSFIMLCCVLLAAYWLRRAFRPVPLVEKLVLLGYLGAVAFAGEFLFLLDWWNRGTLWLLAGYALWVATLGALPKPVSAEQWRSFRTWMAYLLEFDTSPLVAAVRPLVRRGSRTRPGGGRDAAGRGAAGRGRVPGARGRSRSGGRRPGAEGAARPGRDLAREDAAAS